MHYNEIDYYPENIGRTRCHIQFCYIPCLFHCTVRPPQSKKIIIQQKSSDPKEVQKFVIH